MNATELSYRIKNIDNSIERIEKAVGLLSEKVGNTIDGKDEKPGLKGQVLSNKESLVRLWWFVGSCVVSIMGLIASSFKKIWG